MATAVLWTGGKDCVAAALRSGALAAPATRLVTAVPAGERAAFRCHPLPLIAEQAAALNLPHERIAIARDGWEASYRTAFAALAADGVRRIVTGDRTVAPWLRAAADAAGIELAVPLAGEAGPAAVLELLAAHAAVVTVTGVRADRYRPELLGRPLEPALLVGDDAGRSELAGERGEYHTLVTAYRGRPLLAVDLATLPHVERDGIWSLDLSGARA